MRTGRGGLVSALALALLVLGGCASTEGTGVTDPGNTSDPLTLEEAKAFTIQVQSELAGYIAEEDVASRRDITKAHLLQCGGGEYKWPGGVQLTLSGAVDQPSVLEAIRADYGGSPEWTVTDQADKPGLELRHENSSGFFVEFVEPRNQFAVMSFSACFAFDPGLGEEY